VSIVCANTPEEEEEKNDVMCFTLFEINRAQVWKGEELKVDNEEKNKNTEEQRCFIEHLVIFLLINKYETNELQDKY
jgi:hypothetical protein